MQPVPIAEHSSTYGDLWLIGDAGFSRTTTPLIVEVEISPGVVPGTHPPIPLKVILLRIAPSLK